MSIAIGNNILGGMSNFAYGYLGKIKPKIDKNDDALWSKSEVQGYADAYKKATGVKLDVDKLMETYGNDNGYIDTRGQAQVDKDDALGLSRLYANNSSSSTATGASTTMTTAQKEAISSAVDKYTYTLYGSLQPSLEKNDDGRWSKVELQNYSDAYTKATGAKLDVDALMEKYGKNGFIDPSGQNAMKADDALGLKNLQSMLVKAAAEPANTSGTSPGQNSGQNSFGFSLEDIMRDMNSTQKASFSRMYQRYEAQQNLLNSFASGTGGGLFSLLGASSSMNMFKFQSSLYNTSSMYSAMSGSLMNFTI